MNKEEQLKIYAAYLPYGLEFISKKDNDRYLLTDVKSIDEYPLWASTGFNEIKLKYEPDINLKPNGGIGNGFKFDDVKPVLYPLDYLTKEIEHEGEMFIPKDKLFGQGQRWKHFKSSMNKNAFHCLEFWVVEKLIEWHFNIFSIPEGEYINKATLNN